MQLSEEDNESLTCITFILVVINELNFNKILIGTLKLQKLIAYGQAQSCMDRLKGQKTFLS